MHCVFIRLLPLALAAIVSMQNSFASQDFYDGEACFFSDRLAEKLDSILIQKGEFCGRGNSLPALRIYSLDTDAILAREIDVYHLGRSFLQGHPGVVQCLYLQPDQRNEMILERVDGTLAEFLTDKKRHFDIEVVKKIIFDLANTLVHLHNQQLSHNDLNFKSISISFQDVQAEGVHPEFTVKIGNFAQATFISGLPEAMQFKMIRNDWLHLSRIAIKLRELVYASALHSGHRSFFWNEFLDSAKEKTHPEKLRAKNFAPTGDFSSFLKLLTHPHLGDKKLSLDTIVTHPWLKIEP